MKHTESKIQSECVKWFRLFYRRYTPLLFAVPNGGARNRITGAILKSEGVIPGVADMILLLPRGGYHALCIEMKTETGRAEREPKEVAGGGRAGGLPVCRMPIGEGVCRGGYALH